MNMNIRYNQCRAYRVVQVVQDTTALKFEGRTCNVKARKLNLVIISRILRKYYLNLFSIKYQNNPESSNQRETSSGILMGQIVPSYICWERAANSYCLQTHQVQICLGEGIEKFNKIIYNYLRKNPAPLNFYFDFNQNLISS